MKTINIKGKEYCPVNERLKEFRSKFQGYSLTTQILHLDEHSCTMQATILDCDGRVIAVGTAREEREDKSSMVNKTSYVENCETSAWGRALGNFGIGIDESIASADEVARAVAKQDQSKKPNTNFTPSISLAEELETARWTQGKHTGELIKDTDTDYLKWYVEKGQDKRRIELCKLAIKDKEFYEGMTEVATEDDGLLPWD